MEKVESNITQFTEAASERFRKAFAIYKRRLKDNPDLNLRVFCHEVHVDYAGMSSWCNHHGVGLLKLRREAQTGMLTGEPMTFIQVQPSCTTPSSGSLYLRGISITFPDGVNLTLQESSVESVISLLSIYQSRQGGAASCSD